MFSNCCWGSSSEDLKATELREHSNRPQLAAIADSSALLKSPQHVNTSSPPTPEPATDDGPHGISLPSENSSHNLPIVTEQNNKPPPSPLQIAKKGNTWSHPEPSKPQITKNNTPTARSSEQSISSFKLARRVNTLSSPKFGEGVGIIIVTFFQGEKFKYSLNLPRTQDSTEKTYKYIEGTSKQIWDRYCADPGRDKELYLAEGYCIIACGGRQGKGGCKTILPQRLRLESAEDWSEIETAVQNYEQNDDKHKNIRVAITRKLDLCKKTVGMADLPPKEINIRTWMWKEIHKAKVRSASEKSQKYIPKDELHKFTTEDIIRRVVEDATDVVCDPAPNGIDDNMKILPRDQPACLDGIQDEDEIHYEALVDAQWSFKAVFFDIIGKDYKLQADEIVPFISRAQCGKGASSLVYKLNENPELAVKVINSQWKSAPDAFKNERLVVKGLQDLTHDHIIKLFATYTQEGVHHFIFPLAQGNLEQYMEVNPRYFNNPDSDESKEFTAWIIGQFAGVASGIAAIHVKSTESKNSPKEEVTATLLDPKVEKEQEDRPAGTGYHHDIKPQNLLLLAAERDSNSHGIIQIADFGIGKFHSIHSGTGTTTYRGTVTYAAPESKVPEEVDSPGGSRAMKKLNLSRPYDVWSLGCVLMEVTVWVVFGTLGWERFNSARDGPESCEPHASITNSFFKLDENGHPTVRQAVNDEMDELRMSPRLQDPNGSLAGLLSLVEEVLNVSPRKRMSAKDLTERLTILADLAEKEAHISSLENQTRGVTTPISNTPAISVMNHDAVHYYSNRTPPGARAQPRTGILKDIVWDGTAGPARSRSTTPTRRNPLLIGTTESQPPSVHFAEPSPTLFSSRAETWKTTTTNSSLDVAPSTTRQDGEFRGGN